ncbi:UPF0755 protein [Enterovirga rhinocerotis]|uniref:Endolytic murein transglycosylase n=2 Tax=Enterovirga rhinocerotis TaxID=1339210 RepID=A0A4R7BX24_9HYPH|nr:UPF0755 protein [Enterovirga rhinocerotis]
MSGLLTAAVVVAGVVVFGLISVSHEVGKPGPLDADKVVLIPRNTGTSEISALLTKEGVIDNPVLFELYSYANRTKGQLKAGEFLFKAKVSMAQAIDTLIGGKAILHSFTVPEGLTSEQVVTRLRENEILTGDLNAIPPEGSLLPDTYRFERGMTRQQVVNEMQRASRRALQHVWERRSPDLPIKTQQELVILASIVEKETGRGDERARVASVFLNRLQRRMKLQSDPTIVYGIVGGKGTLGRGILRSEIDRATPYNTYVIEGLPPGPIANPGRAALEAVANPLKTKDLFFVADGTGGHAFAETYDQHQRNVARWRQIERAREAAPAGEVDRAAPAPDNRTDYEAASPIRTASTGDEPLSISAGRAFDAVEGTSLDPLANKTWDLTTPKTVPSFGPEPVAQPAPRPARASRTSRRREQEQSRAAEPGLPPGVRMPPR